MGNCMETYGGARDHERQLQEEMKRTDLDYDNSNNNNSMEEDERENIKGFGGSDENGFDDEKKNTVFRVKIVLTREELEWFLLQLQDNNKGGNKKKKKLEDVLGEMQRSSSSSSKTGRWKVDDDQDGNGWKPSLDSIMESPEVPDQMDR